MDHASIPMQQQQQQQRHVNGGEGRSGGGGGGGGGGAAGNVSLACRPSGTRWTPTSEQIGILRELYYGCGIRSPNAEQIQRIAARLRQYGRIEGKNVFYWFQNHKARERQKKRLTTLDVNTSAAADGSHLPAGVLSLSPSGAAAAASSAGMYAGNGGTASQQEASTNCWDSTAMVTDRSFMQLQDYMGVRSAGGQHHGGAGDATPWACFPFTADQTPMTATREPETLPLFPTGGRHGGPGEGDHGHQESIVHGGYLQSNNFQCWGAAAAAATTITAQQHHQLLQQLQEQHSFYSSSNQLPSQDAAGGEGTSLELTLSSYCSPYPGRSM